MCEAKYCVPVDAVGHRAHCSKCDSVFRVAQLPASNHKNPFSPTEDDIIRWLSEGRDKDDLPVRPRIIDGATAKTVEDDNLTDKKKALKARSRRIPPPPSEELPNSQPDVPAKEMKLRQTG